jgi:diguanylate cyclase (GGDEF)-like protein/PAS domain S-box-containing protein
MSSSPAKKPDSSITPELIIAAFEAVDIPFALWNRSFCLQQCNSSYERFAGWPRSQMAGRSVEQLYGAAAWDTARAGFERAFAGEAATYDRLVRQEHGLPRWYRVRLTPAAIDGEGHVSGVFSSVIDVDDHVKSRDAALLSAKRIQRVLSAVDLPIGCWDRDARLTFCNEPYERWARRTREQLLGKTLEQIYGPRAWEAARPAFEKAFTGQIAHYTRMVQHQERDHWMRITAFPDCDDTGNAVAVYTIAFDIDDEMRAIEELARSKKQLDMLSDNIPYPLTYFDRDFVYRFVNKAFAQRFNLNPQDAIGKSVREVRGEELWQEHSPYAKIALSGKEARYERLALRPDGTRRWTRSSYMPDIDDDGNVRGVYSATMDIHEIKLAQEALARRAERDSLTDAYNRSYLMTRLEHLIQRCTHAPFTLFFVDLDGFKLVNDRSGHAAGDALLKVIAQRLQENVRDEEIVARFGGDEFVVVTHAVDDAAITSMAQRILAAACTPTQFETHVLQVSASVGVAVAPAHAHSVADLMRRADEAMYEAKRLGKNAWSVCAGPDAASAQTA